MGQRHREKRKITKSLARRFGMRETELGELKQQVSKAEHRRRFIRGLERSWAEHDIINAAIARATADIVAVEDAAFLATIEHALEMLRSEVAVEQ